jgi:hypothetical protein
VGVAEPYLCSAIALGFWVYAALKLIPKQRFLVKCQRMRVGRPGVQSTDQGVLELPCAASESERRLEDLLLRGISSSRRP